MHYGPKFYSIWLAASEITYSLSRQFIWTSTSHMLKKIEWILTYYFSPVVTVMWPMAIWYALQNLAGSSRSSGSGNYSPTVLWIHTTLSHTIFHLLISRDYQCSQDMLDTVRMIFLNDILRGSNAPLMSQPGPGVNGDAWPVYLCWKLPLMNFSKETLQTNKATKDTWSCAHMNQTDR